MFHEQDNVEADLTTQEQKAVRDLEAFLQGSQGVSEEDARAGWEALSLQGWLHLQKRVRHGIGDSRESQRAWEKFLKRLKRLEP
jgi:hypothetical protein